MNDYTKKDYAPAEFEIIIIDNSDIVCSSFPFVGDVDPDDEESF